MKSLSLFAGFVVVVALAVSAQADTVSIAPSAFSGNETVITFSNATDYKIGNSITVGGVTFTSRAGGNVVSGYYYGFDRGYLFGTPAGVSDDGQLMDLVAQTDLDIIFASPVNRVGMDLATMLSYPQVPSYQTWRYEAYNGDELVGSGSVTSGAVIASQGSTVTGRTFLGFESSDPITRVRLFETAADSSFNSGQVTVMDNLRFESVAAAAVPLPSVATTGLALMGMTALMRRRRPR